MSLDPMAEVEVTGNRTRGRQYTMGSANGPCQARLGSTSLWPARHADGNSSRQQPGAARFFVHQVDQSDPVRGRYIDNTEIADVVLETVDPHQGSRFDQDGERSAPNVTAP